VLTSPPQLDELKYYTDLGWIKLVNTDIAHWGHLFAIHSSQMPKECSYDLGFFSSGEWGRSGGLMRTDNLEGILQNSKNDNEYWQLSKSILSFMVIYVRRHDLTLKIYLHPWEKELIKRFGIYPPFVEYADGKNVFLSEDYDSYCSNFFDAKIGVVTISSILYDRMQFNLETYYFSPKQEKWTVPRKNYYNKIFLPTYSEYAFESIDELESKLDKSFNITTGRKDSN